VFFFQGGFFIGSLPSPTKLADLICAPGMVRPVPLGWTPESPPVDIPFADAPFLMAFNSLFYCRFTRENFEKLLPEGALDQCEVFFEIFFSKLRFYTI
jgi:hypothetical protein